MANNDLQTYMSDHLGGARAGVELAARLVSTSDTPAERETFERLHAAIEADRRTLEEMFERIGGYPSVTRQAGGWVAEKLASLKMRWDDPSGRGLMYFEALETLSLGVLGKRALWRALRAAGHAAAELRGYDFDQLEQRAQDQFDTIESRRLEAARRTFGQTRQA